MAKSSIEWTDKVWNPVTGCTKVSAGCANCYAETFARRGMGPWKGRKFEDVRCHEDRLAQPSHWKKPSKIFVNSMSDLFHEDIPVEFLGECFITMARNPRHVFQVLTKRPQRMFEFFKKFESHGGKPAPNIWLGVSVENQKAADERIPLLLQTPAAVRFLSVEPMLEKIDLKSESIQDSFANKPWPQPLDWVICGGESGPKARPFNIEWARDLRNQCKEAAVPFFMKQIGSKPYWERHLVGACSPRGYQGLFPTKDRKGGDMAEWPEDLRIREFPR
jgi:protein gp37